MTELLLGRWTQIVGGLVEPVPGRPPAEPVQRWVHGLVWQGTVRRPVDLWLRALAPHAAEWVADRLRAQGLCIRGEVRRGLRRQPVWRVRPVDPMTAAYVAVALRTGIARPELMYADDIALLGVAMATELVGPVVLWDGEQPPDSIRELLTRLDDGMRSVVAHTEAVIGHAVLTH